MATIKEEVSWTGADQDEQLKKDLLRRQRDEDLRDDDLLSSDRVRDSKLPNGEYDAADEDDETLSDDDVNGRDLDPENADEWDEENVDELDDSDLDDDDQANADVHGIKNDQFGSLGKSIKNENVPDPDEIPEEHEPGKELDYPDDDKLEQGREDEVTYNEPKEVTPPAPEGEPHERRATLDNLDPSFTDQTHGRTTGRMIDHEPGTPNNL